MNQGAASSEAKSDTAAPLLSVEGIVKSFQGHRALDDVSLDVHSGEIVAVIGHNGSGKSTLVKVLACIHTQDSGTAILHESSGSRPEMHFIHQDLGLIPELTTVENLNLCRNDGTSALAPHDVKRETERALELIGRFGALFPVDRPVAALSSAQRSIVAIARALDSWTHERNVLILDEPTEALHSSEVETLFDAVRKLAAAGAGIVFISHRLDEVQALADRVVVLRDGRKVADEPRAALDHAHLIQLVSGAVKFSAESRERNVPVDPPVLSIRGMTGKSVHDFNLDLFPGETVGIAGVLGSGREEVPSMIFGATASTAASFVVDGAPLTSRTPRTSIRAGLAFVAGDRARLGSVRAMNARENITLPNLTAFRTRWGTVKRKSEAREATAQMAAFEVRPPRPEQLFASFSGGNQQKMVLAKWLRNKPKVLLMEEPTQGVDIGAKLTIYTAVEEARQAGTAVLVCSSDSKELLRLCDRVLVLRDGRVVAELSGESLSEHRLITEGYGLADERPVTPDSSR